MSEQSGGGMTEQSGGGMSDGAGGGHGAAGVGLPHHHPLFENAPLAPSSTAALSHPRLPGAIVEPPEAPHFLHRSRPGQRSGRQGSAERRAGRVWRSISSKECRPRRLMLRAPRPGQSNPPSCCLPNTRAETRQRRPIQRRCKVAFSRQDAGGSRGLPLPSDPLVPSLSPSAAEPHGLAKRRLRDADGWLAAHHAGGPAHAGGAVALPLWARSLQAAEAEASGAAAAAWEQAQRRHAAQQQQQQQQPFAPQQGGSAGWLGRLWPLAGAEAALAARRQHQQGHASAAAQPELVPAGRSSAPSSRAPSSAGDGPASHQDIQAGRGAAVVAGAWQHEVAMSVHRHLASPPPHAAPRPSSGAVLRWVERRTTALHAAVRAGGGGDWAGVATAGGAGPPPPPSRPAEARRAPPQPQQQLQLQLQVRQREQQQREQLQWRDTYDVAASYMGSSPELLGRAVSPDVPGGAAASGAAGARSAAAPTEDTDWLTAVLSAPTSRLSTHSNAVLANSLRRLASLRLAGGTGAGVEGVEGADGMAGLLQSVRVRLPTFELQDFEEVALQLAQLGCQPDSDWLAALERHSMSVMPGGSPRLLSRLLLARAKLSPSASAPWCDACLHHMAAQPERMTVSSWVNALSALVKLKHTPSRQFQAVFFSSSASRLDDVSPDLLTHLVLAAARLQLAPTYLWWRSLVAAAAGIRKPFTHAQLAAFVHGVALWAEPGGVAARDVQLLVDLLLSEVDAQLAVMQPAELTAIVWSLGTLTAAGKLLPDAELQGRLLQAVQGQLPRLTPPQLSSLCWGLAKLDQPLPAGFPEALLLEAQAHAGEFTHAALATVLWALARLGLAPRSPFRQALWEELRARCPAVGAQDLSTVLWALAKLRLQPPPDLLADLLEAALAHAVPPGACSPLSLANLVWALGRLGARPGAAWLAELEAAALAVLPSAGLTELVNLAWGLLAMGGAGQAAAAADGGEAPPGAAGGGLAVAPSASWKAACLREVRLRCRCHGHELDCTALAALLEELGVPGLGDAAAIADASFWDEDGEGGDGCPVEFQPGCR